MIRDHLLYLTTITAGTVTLNKLLQRVKRFVIYNEKYIVINAFVMY
jgi:hypothetical protein